MLQTRQEGDPENTLMTNAAKCGAPSQEVRICSMDLAGLTGEANCPVPTLLQLASVIPKLESYLKANNLERGAAHAYLGNGYIDFFAAPSAKGPSQRSLVLGGSSQCEKMRDEYADGLNELIKSHKENRAPRLAPRMAKAISDLSDIASKGNGVGNLRMFPDSNETWMVPPADRNKTRCSVTADSRIGSICGAVVLGVRAAQEPQGDLFFSASEEVPVIITLTGELSEIRHTMKIVEAQALWRGTCCLDASVRIEKGELPVVVGEISIHYM